MSIKSDFFKLKTTKTEDKIPRFGAVMTPLSRKNMSDNANYSISSDCYCKSNLFNLQVSSFVSSHSPEYWTNPEEFNPYRLDDEEHLKRYERTKRQIIIQVILPAVG